MTVRYLQPDNHGIYFITFSCRNWLPLFEITNSYNLVYDWFNFLTGNGNYICGYVIMPNHVHAVIAFRNHRFSINKRVGEGKRFIAYGIVERLKDLKRMDILNTLQEATNNTERAIGKKHSVFETSFDCKVCRSMDFIVQKLDYINNNPCAGKWMLADSPVNYTHCSAKFWFTSEQGIYPVTNYMDVMGLDLSVEWQNVAK